MHLQTFVGMQCMTEYHQPILSIDGTKAQNYPRGNCSRTNELDFSSAATATKRVNHFFAFIARFVCC